MVKIFFSFSLTWSAEAHYCGDPWPSKWQNTTTVFKKCCHAFNFIIINKGNSCPNSTCLLFIHPTLLITRGPTSKQDMGWIHNIQNGSVAIYIKRESDGTRKTFGATKWLWSNLVLYAVIMNASTWSWRFNSIIAQSMLWLPI